MVDIRSWVSSSFFLEVHKDLLLDWGKTLQVHKAASSEALVSSIAHALHVSHVTGDDITSSVVDVVFSVVVGLDSVLLVLVIVVDSLDIVDVGIGCGRCS